MVSTRLAANVYSTVLLMCTVLSPGCRATVYQMADLKRSTGLVYLSKPYLTSHVSCTTQFKSKVVISLTCLWSHALSFLFSFAVLCTMSGAAPLPGVDTVAGRLQECEALSQVSGSVSVLPTSITKQLRSLYSHQLPRHSHFYCARASEESTSSFSLKEENGSVLMNSWSCWSSDRNLPISLCLSLRTIMCNLKGINEKTI